MAPHGRVRHHHRGLAHRPPRHRYRHGALRRSLDLRNVFNRRHYSYSLFSAVNTYTYSYRLRGRELWLTASLTR